MGVKITVKLFRKNVICVKVSFLTAIFFLLFLYALLCLFVCVCEKSATSRKYLVSLRYQKSPLPNSSPGAFIRTAESARPSSRRNNSRSKRRQMTEREQIRSFSSRFAMGQLRALSLSLSWTKATVTFVPSRNRLPPLLQFLPHRHRWWYFAHLLLLLVVSSGAAAAVADD